MKPSCRSIAEDGRNTHMMTVNAVLHLAILATSARVEPRQKGDGYYLIGSRLVFVLEAALVSFRTGSSQIMIVAEFVVVLALLDVV
jgi:hypothetical protein